MNDKKDVLRPTIVMSVFVGLLGMWVGRCEGCDISECSL